MMDKKILAVLMCAVIVPLILIITLSFLPKFEWTESWENKDKGSESNAMAIDSKNNIYITGSSGKIDDNHSELVLLKYYTSGNLIWDEIWRDDKDAYGYGIAIDSKDNIYITGCSGDKYEGLTDVLLVKYNSSGNEIWNKTWDFNGAYDRGNAIAIDSKDNIYITGIKSLFPLYYDLLLLKCDSSGNILWNKTWENDEFAKGYGIAIDKKDNIYITGSTGEFVETSEVILLKFNSSGNLLWEEKWNEMEKAKGEGIAVDSENNIFITGYAKPEKKKNDCFDVILLKYDSNGKNLWTQTWGYFDTDLGTSIVFDDNNLYVTGYTNINHRSHLFLLKYDISGNLIWDKTWTDYSSSKEICFGGESIVIDDEKNIFITCHYKGDIILILSLDNPFSTIGNIFLIIIVLLSLIEIPIVINYIITVKKNAKVRLHEPTRLKEFPRSRIMIEILREENGSERFDLLKKFDTTTLSKEFWEKLERFDWNEEGKQSFISEMLALSSAEREAIMDEMIRNDERFRKEMNGKNKKKKS